MTNLQDNSRANIVDEISVPSVTSTTYFPVSPLKLLVMSFCTLGLYEIYWFHINWRLIKERENLDIKPVWRAIFAYFFCYSLFKRIHATAESQKIQKSFSPVIIATGWIILTLMWKLPDPYWLITCSSIFFLLPVQISVNEINQLLTPNHETNTKFSGWNIVTIVTGGALFVLGIIGAFQAA